MTRYPLAPPVVVDPPPVTPPLHSLVASATPITDETNGRWEDGFTFWPENCVDAKPWYPGDRSGGPSSDVQTLKSVAPGDAGSDVDNNQVQIVYPPTFETAFSCDATGWESIDYQGRARRQVISALPKALEYEFWTGTLMPENYNLVSNTPAVAATEWGGILNPMAAGLWTAMKPQDALSSLVGALASCGPGSRGMIHAPAEIAELWAETMALIQDGPRLVTKTRGNIVVSGGGYPGTGPAALATDNGGSAAAQASPGPGAMWVYATDMVFVRQGDPVVYPDTLPQAMIRTAEGRRTNKIEFRGEQVAAAYTSACCTFAVLVSTTGGT